MSIDYSIAQQEVLTEHGISRSGAELLHAWDALVQEVEEGYDWDVSEYRNELQVRDDLEAIGSSAALRQFAQHSEFLGRLRRSDERFKAMAHPAYQFPVTGGWWRRVVPNKAGDEFAGYCYTVYGFVLEVVS